MRRKRTWELTALAICISLLFGACAPQAGDAESRISGPPSPAAPLPAEEPAVPARTYVERLADAVVREEIKANLPREEQVRTLYRYLVERVYFADPVGLDVWRYESEDGEAIPYLENRALSPLRFQIGSCEDFAAAMALLLRSVGFEAEYVAGYTLSVDQVYVDHAWAVVKLEGEWYHLDPQLEQNVTRQNLLTYRYYLKSDEEFLRDHKWGENLIAYYWDTSEEEAANIRAQHMPPACPAAHPAPEPVYIPLPARPNMADIDAEILDIRSQSAGAALPPLRLNVEPPVLIAAMHVTPPLTQTTPSAAFRYGRGFLSGASAELYDELAALTRSPVDGASPSVPAGMDDEEARRVARTFLDDHPLSCWMDLSVEQVENGRALRLSTRVPADEMRRRERLIEARVEEILADARDADAFEKALVIHDAVAIIAYDRDGVGENSANVYGALVEGAATCDGYARAFQHLADAAELESVYIRGRGLTGAPHAWNAIRLDGVWHYVDATWDRPRHSYDDVYHDYFLMDESEMLAERTPDAEQYPQLPQVETGYRSYFERMGYAVSGPVPADSAGVMAEVLYRQLAAKQAYSGAEQPVYLEFKVLGDKSTYEAWKRIYIKQVFAVLRELETRARKGRVPFLIADTAAVKCDFNDTTQVLSFYPSVVGMEE